MPSLLPSCTAPLALQQLRASLIPRSSSWLLLAWTPLSDTLLCLCACSNFAPLELAEFQKLMNSVKRGDIVGVAGELK